MCRAEFAASEQSTRDALGGGRLHTHFRETMQNVLIVIHLIIVVALVGVVLLQRSEGGGLGMGSGGGGAGGFMTGRGQANALTRATAILAGAFFLTSIILAVMATHGRVQRSIIDGAPGDQRARDAGWPERPQCGRRARPAQATSGPGRRLATADATGSAAAVTKTCPAKVVPTFG